MPNYPKALRVLLAITLLGLSLARLPAGAAGTDAHFRVARDINALGFSEWSQMFYFPGVNFPGADVTVCPPAIWYLDQFTGRKWQPPDARMMTILNDLVRRGRLTATVRVNRDRVALTTSDLAAARAWRASTTWVPADLSDLQVEMSLGETFAFAGNSPIEMPFVSSDGLRAVRFDSSDGHTEVFVIQGTSGRLTEFRKNLTESAWERFIGQFRKTGVKLDTFDLSRTAYMEVPSHSATLLNTVIMPATVVLGAISANQSFILTPQGGHFAVSAVIRGLAVPPPVTHHLSNGTTVTVYHLSAPPMYDLAPPLPKGQYISLLQPLIYVVVDRPSGVVLLIGMHE